MIEAMIALSSVKNSLQVTLRAGAAGAAAPALCFAWDAGAKSALCSTGKYWKQGVFRGAESAAKTFCALFWKFVYENAIKSNF